MFADQVAAWEALEPSLKDRVANLQGIHSARRSYAPDGFYGEKDKGRSMAIRYSEDAYACHPHPIGRPHEETGATALFVSPAYTIGIDGMDDAEADEILRELYAHQAKKPLFIVSVGSRICWSFGIIARWFTWQPAATRVTIECCNA